MLEVFRREHDLVRHHLQSEQPFQFGQGVVGLQRGQVDGLQDAVNVIGVNLSLLLIPIPNNVGIQRVVDIPLRRTFTNDGSLRDSVPLLGVVGALEHIVDVGAALGGLPADFSVGFREGMERFRYIGRPFSRVFYYSRLYAKVLPQQGFLVEKTRNF